VARGNDQKAGAHYRALFVTLVAREISKYRLGSVVIVALFRGVDDALIRHKPRSAVFDGETVSPSPGSAIGRRFTSATRRIFFG
jgi:hypothetical protein